MKRKTKRIEFLGCVLLVGKYPRKITVPNFIKQLPGIYTFHLFRFHCTVFLPTKHFSH